MQIVKATSIPATLVSGINIINRTNENTVRVAVFQQADPLPSGNVVAWRVTAPAANGGSSRVLVPDEYTMQILSRDPGVENTSNQVSWNGYTAHLALDLIDTPDGGVTRSLKLEGTNVTPEGHIQTAIPGNTGQQVFLEVFKEGSMILPQIPVSPGFTADLIIKPIFYLAVVTEMTKPGAVLQARTLQTTTTAIQPGSSATVTGSAQTGYSISVE